MLLFGMLLTGCVTWERSRERPATATSSTLTGTSPGSSTINTFDNREHAFLYNGSTMQDLGAIGDNDFLSDRSFGYGINIHDEVVGSTYRPYTGGALYQIAFVYRDGQMFDLETLVDASGADYRLYVATGINDAGQIAVDAIKISTGKIRAVLLTPSGAGTDTVTITKAVYTPRENLNRSGDRLGSERSFAGLHHVERYPARDDEKEGKRLLRQIFGRFQPPEHHREKQSGRKRYFISQRKMRSPPTTPLARRFGPVLPATGSLTTRSARKFRQSYPCLRPEWAYAAPVRLNSTNPVDTVAS